MLLKNYIKLQILYNNVVGKYIFLYLTTQKNLQLLKTATERTVAYAIRSARKKRRQV